MSAPIYRPLADLSLEGFHAEGNRYYQMVPVGSERNLRVMRAGGLIFKTSPTSDTIPDSEAHRFCIWQESGFNMTDVRLVRLRGVQHGLVEYTAIGKGQIYQKFSVFIRRRKYVRVAFHFVSDSEGHRTTRSKSMVDGAIQKMNDILTPQANVQFVLNGIRNVTVPEDLGCLIGGESEALCREEWGKIVRYRDPLADWNVFFVWDLRSSKSGDLVLASNAMKDCLVDDTTNEARLGRVLAHEYCHSRACPHVAEGLDKFLMNDTDRGGTALTLSNLLKISS